MINRQVAIVVAPTTLLGVFSVIATTMPKNAPPQKALGSDSACVRCHAKVTPGIVNDWRLSKHAQMGIVCSACHGSDHKSAADVSKVKIPTPDTCGQCHPQRLAQFKAGKHALSWASMKAMPTFHAQPVALTEGMKGCGGCHKIGLKTPEEIRELQRTNGGFGVASCDACHTRHTFSLAEARSPEACMTCHMGFDHPQYEMYASSKHGVRFDLKQKHVIPASASAPTCQDCHMQGGDHNVRTAWGFIGMRVPLPKDPQWQADQATILKALGVLTPDGQPTPRLDAIKKLDIVRFTEADFQKERRKMEATCARCHSSNFVRNELQKGDHMIREADHLMAQAINIVAGLYRDGILAKPKEYAYPFPDMLTFHDAPTQIEQKLFVMYFEHRNRTFQGTFHANPDYALWYGWSEMQRDLTEIKTLAQDLRERHAMGAKPAAE